MDAPGFDWSDFQVLATELSTQSRESALRTAVSRAYYYAFHISRARLRALGFYFTPSEGSHMQVWEKYLNSPDPACKRIGELAKRLKAKRQVADYEPYFARLEDEAPAMVQLATTLAAELEALRSDLPRNTGSR